MQKEVHETFRGLADPTRRQILMHLRGQDLTIAEVTNHFEITRAAVKKHLVILEKGNLISVEVSGRERINKLRPQSLKAVAEWLGYFNQFWDEKLEGLKSAVENREKNV